MRPIRAVFGGFLEEGSRAGLPVQIVARWALIAAAVFQVNLVAGTPAVIQVLLNVLIGCVAAFNAYLTFRLGDPRPMRGIVVAAASIFDVAAISVAIAAVDRFDNPTVLFYYPAFIAFAVVFPGRYSIVYTAVTMAIYVAIVLPHPNFDPSLPADLKAIGVRLITMSVTSLVTNMTMRIERARRIRAVNEALASHLERQRVSQEMHDGIAQELYMLALNLEANTKLVEEQTADPELPARMRSLVALAKQALLETRSLLFNLEPALVGDQGIVPLLTEQAAEFSAVTRIPLSVVEHGPTPALAPEVVVEVYRIVQEGLSNMYRHSGAAAGALTVSHEDGVVSVTLSDDGQGFDPDEPRSRGYGLQGMQERAERIGGSLVVESSPGLGTRLALTVPVRRS